MHLVFVDQIPWGYTIDAPFHRPIGGTQSAACYLMLALAALGVRVSFINNAEPHTYGGVVALGNHFAANAIADADAFIHLTDSTVEYPLRLGAAAPRAQKILWQHLAPDQPAGRPLADPQTLDAWDGFVFVSAWQEQQYLNAFPALSAKPRQVMRNGISPVFENLFDDLPVLAFKSRAPLLAYTSMPARGLDRLILAWPGILDAHPGAELQIFSDMKMYTAENPAPIAQLLSFAAASPGVVHVGSVPQPDLAQAMRASLILAYPNTVPETSCIVAMEAMAAGCIVMTSDLGALPETLHGHGVLMPYEDDAYLHADTFARETTRVLHDLKSQWLSGELETRLAHQARWVNENYVWSKRAVEWMDWLSNPNSLSAAN